VGFVRVESSSSSDVDIARLIFAEAVVGEFESDYRSLQELVVSLGGSTIKLAHGFFFVGSRVEILWWNVVSISLGGAE